MTLCHSLTESYPEILETTSLGENLPEKVVILGERPQSPIRSLSPNCSGNLYREAANEKIRGGKNRCQLHFNSFTVRLLNTEILPASK